MTTYLQKRCRGDSSGANVCVLIIIFSVSASFLFLILSKMQFYMFILFGLWLKLLLQMLTHVLFFWCTPEESESSGIVLHTHVPQTKIRLEMIGNLGKLSNILISIGLVTALPWHLCIAHCSQSRHGNEHFDCHMPARFLARGFFPIAYSQIT